MADTENTEEHTLPEGLNERRVMLIGKKYDAGLTAAEESELEDLQARALEEADKGLTGIEPKHLADLERVYKEITEGGKHPAEA